MRQNFSEKKLLAGEPLFIKSKADLIKQRLDGELSDSDENIDHQRKELHKSKLQL